MQKRKTKITPKFLSLCAVMAAFSIVLGKYLAVNVGENFRFSLENLPLILAGLYFGPTAGALVGAVADLVGCLLVGYAINPIITLGAVSIGICSGMIGSILKEKKALQLFIAVSLSHIIGSVIIKTLGLHIYYGSPFFATLAWRFVIYLGTGLVEFGILYLLKSNLAFEKQMHSVLQ